MADGGRVTYTPRPEDDVPIPERPRRQKTEEKEPKEPNKANWLGRVVGGLVGSTAEKLRDRKLKNKEALDAAD